MRIYIFNELYICNMLISRSEIRLLFTDIQNNFSTSIWKCFNFKFRDFMQQNRYLSVILVCGYFSFIRSFTWLNFPRESKSYHKTSLSMIYGCCQLSGIQLFPLHFAVSTIAWQRKFATRWVYTISVVKGEIPATLIMCILRNSHIIY